MRNNNRRQFLKSLGAGAALGVTGAGSALAQNRAGSAARSTSLSARKGKTKSPSLKLGLASYSLRKFDLAQTLAMTKRVGLEYIALKSMHLPLDSSPQQIATALQQVKKAGLKLYGAGVVYMKNEDAVHQAFAYAQAAGMKVIIGVPQPNLLDLVEKKVKEYDIKVAVHNHGPTDKVYPIPASVYELVKNRDPRIGICNDIGHTQRAGVDPADSIYKYRDRLIDLHVKDVTLAAAKGHGCEMGRGVIDIPKVLRTLVKINFQGVVSFEYEKDAGDPLPGLAESVGYLKGVLATL